MRSHTRSCSKAATNISAFYTSTHVLSLAITLNMSGCPTGSGCRWVAPPNKALHSAVLNWMVELESGATICVEEALTPISGFKLPGLFCQQLLEPVDNFTFRCRAPKIVAL